MASANLRLPAKPKRGAWLLPGLWLIGCIVIVVAFFAFAPTTISLDDPTFLIACAVFIIILFGALAHIRAQSLDSRKSSLTLAAVTWWLLMISEQIFAHSSTTLQTATGGVVTEAYQEAASWGIAFLVLLLIMMLRPVSWRPMFSGSYLWISLFALLTIVSLPFSESRTYSLVWALKLAIVVLLLQLFAAAVERTEDLMGLLYAMLAGLSVIVVMRIVRAILSPEPLFLGGRLNEYASPTGLSALAGILLLLSLTLYAIRRRGWLIFVAAFALLAMLVAGGKAGIAAGLISAMAFFLLQKRVRRAMGLLLAVLAIGAVLLVATPLGSYFQDYSQTGQGATFTGRTDLWDVVWPEILHKPIVGHGYMSSRFLALDVEVAWDPGHTHNSFLEALYNNGIPGFLLILVMNFVIVRNLLRAISRPLSRESFCLAVGSFAIYLDLLIDGLFKVTFGGVADSSFMVFLALVVISIKVVGDSRPRVQTSPIIPAGSV